MKTVESDFGAMSFVEGLFLWWVWENLRWRAKLLNWSNVFFDILIVVISFFHFISYHSISFHVMRLVSVKERTSENL